ncbi:hypothetical protein [Nevskia sp.]|uniref:hypothetical protein n=1 Tax=Nevskia sp. TaxID=1929292 RepID=UPI0025E1E4D9|nr:hypothetical protein [Nevskia sp.]
MKLPSSWRRVPAITALALIPALAPGLATAADYNYIEGGFLLRDNYGSSEGGFRVGGSVELTGPLAAYSEFTTNNDVNQFSVGAVFHNPITREVDWFAGGGLEYVDVGNTDDLGFGLRGGIHWTPSKLVTLTPELRYYDAVGDGQFSARLSGSYNLTPQFALVAAVQGGDDDRFEAGIRYRFGRVF